MSEGKTGDLSRTNDVPINTFGDLYRDKRHKSPRNKMVSPSLRLKERGAAETRKDVISEIHAARLKNSDPRALLTRMRDKIKNVKAAAGGLTKRYLEGGKNSGSLEAAHYKMRASQLPSLETSQDVNADLDQRLWEERAEANLAAYFHDLEQSDKGSNSSQESETRTATTIVRASDKVVLDIAGTPILPNSYDKYGVRGTLLGLLEHSSDGGDEVYGIFVPHDIALRGKHHSGDETPLVNVVRFNPQNGRFIPSKQGEVRLGERISLGQPQDGEGSTEVSLNDQGNLEITNPSRPVALFAHPESQLIAA